MAPPTFYYSILLSVVVLSKTPVNMKIKRCKTKKKSRSIKRVDKEGG
jgi:hypothetical protein